MDLKHIQEVLSDETFVSELVSKENVEDALALLKSKDIDLTQEDIVQIRDLLVRYSNNELTEKESELMHKYQQADVNELSDEQLESVNGGVLGFFACAAIAAVIAAVGGAAGIGLANAYCDARIRW